MEKTFLDSIPFSNNMHESRIDLQSMPRSVSQSQNISSRRDHTAQCAHENRRPQVRTNCIEDQITCTQDHLNLSVIINQEVANIKILNFDLRAL